MPRRYQTGYLLVVLLGYFLVSWVAAQPLFCPHCGMICHNHTCSFDGHSCVNEWFFPDDSEPAPLPRKGHHPRLTGVDRDTILSQQVLTSFAEEVFSGHSQGEIHYFPTSSPLTSSTLPTLKSANLQKVGGLYRKDNPLSHHKINRFLNDHLQNHLRTSNDIFLVALYQLFLNRWTFIYLTFEAEMVFLWLYGENQALFFVNLDDLEIFLTELAHSMHISELFLFNTTNFHIPETMVPPAVLVHLPEELQIIDIQIVDMVFNPAYYAP